ncbi:MAG: helix-turn-helix transcriptional regulator [Micavibrio sp.]
MSFLKNIPELSERLKYIRKINGLSQIELARICETTQQAIQQAESGKARNPRYLHKMAHALDIPYEWLTMNLVPGVRSSPPGLSEKSREVIDSFNAMPKKDQELLLALMKSRKGKK